MIQVFADDKLIYDSRLEETDLLALKATRTLNSGGKAEIAMPYNHPNYNDFVWQKTVVKIYRDGDLEREILDGTKIDKYDLRPSRS